MLFFTMKLSFFGNASRTSLFPSLFNYDISNFRQLDIVTSAFLMLIRKTKFSDENNY